jgi:hypothetical protein
MMNVKVIDELIERNMKWHDLVESANDESLSQYFSIDKIQQFVERTLG